MDLAKLVTLKEKLQHTDQFDTVWKFFLDHFGENPAFMAMGEPTEQPFLEAVFAAVGQQLLGRQVKVHHVRLIRLAQEGFIHGGALLDSKMANVLYFEDVQAGMLAVVWSMAPGEMKYARFSGRQLRPRGEPSAN
jgi:hypothetical protein